MSTKLAFNMTHLLVNERYNFSPTHMTKKSIPETILLLSQTENTVTEVTRARDELVPAQLKELKGLIRTVRRAVHLCPERTMDRARLAEMRGFQAILKKQQTTYGTVLEKQRELKKQLKRLLSLQRKYLVKHESSGFDEVVERDEMKRKIQMALDRVVRMGSSSYELIRSMKEEVETFDQTCID